MAVASSLARSMGTSSSLGNASFAALRPFTDVVFSTFVRGTMMILRLSMCLKTVVESIALLVCRIHQPQTIRRKVCILSGVAFAEMSISKLQSVRLVLKEEKSIMPNTKSNSTDIIHSMTKS